MDTPAVRCAAAFGAGACFGAYALHRVRRAREGRTRPALEAAPDYRRRSSWYSHFELGAGREERWAPAGYQDGQDRADADVFFAHGTTALEGTGNASVADGESAAYAFFKIARQTSCFTHRCRVYAPKYRQARVGNYHCFEAHAAPDGSKIPDYARARYGKPVGEAAFAVAYMDVYAALEAFLAKKPRGRPWFLAGHSQGAGHCTVALRDLAASEEPWAAAALDDLVAALPLGIQHGADSFPAGPPYAATARDVGVVLCWNTVARGTRDTYAAGRRRFGYVGATAVTAGAPLSLNPFALCGGRHGALCDDGAVRTDVVSSAAVENGVLVARGANIGEYLPSADGDLHVHDFECWWLMIRTTVALRLAAFQEARGLRPRA